MHTSIVAIVWSLILCSDHGCVAVLGRRELTWSESVGALTNGTRCRTPKFVCLLT